jgi:hypothetical protein
MVELIEMIKEIRGGGKEKCKNKNSKIKDVESAEGGAKDEITLGSSRGQ